MILNINKPSNYTSFDIVAIIRKTLRQKRNTKKIKVGHAGTLDPLATGVLIILTDTDTKKQDLIMHQKKEYYCEIAFGATSVTYDLEANLNFATTSLPSLEELSEKINLIIPDYIGEITQTIPAYSAKKVDGERLYVKARENKLDLETLPTKEIKIYSIDVVEFKEVILNDVKLPVMCCNVFCSSGTYIRALANDFGQDLGIGGVLTKLVRTKVGKYKIEDSLTLEQAKNNIS